MDERKYGYILQEGITYLNIAVILFTKQVANKPQLGLSNKIPCVLEALRAANLLG